MCVGLDVKQEVGMRDIGQDVEAVRDPLKEEGILFLDIAVKLEQMC